MTDANTVWVEVSRYCYPWHGEYAICKVRLDAAVLWLKISGWKVILRYPGEKVYAGEEVPFLPTHFGFENEEDATYFKLLFDI